MNGRTKVVLVIALNPLEYRRYAELHGHELSQYRFISSVSQLHGWRGEDVFVAWVGMWWRRCDARALADYVDARGYKQSKREEPWAAA